MDSITAIKLVIRDLEIEKERNDFLLPKLKEMLEKKLSK